MLDQNGPRRTILPTVSLALLFSAAGIPSIPGPGAARDSVPPGRLTFETERVVVFKDGHALFVKRATGTIDADGDAYTDEVPDAAVLGSFWAVAEGAHPIRSTTAEWVETEDLRSRETDCVTPIELLRANEGRKVTLELVGDRELTGEILGVLELDPDGPPQEDPARPRVWSYRNINPPPNAAAPLESVHELVPQRGSLVVITAADAGRVVLPIADVRSVAGDNLITRMERVERVTTRSKRLRYTFGTEAAGRKVVLHMMYFTPGMRWIPTYRLMGELETDAAMSLQAEILNEVEDIDGVELDLVVGVPNFRFKDVVSPLTLEQTLRHALQEAAPNLMGQSMHNTLTQRSGEWRGADTAVSGPNVMSIAPDLASAGSHDLFVYGVPSFSLRKGARATVAVWQSRLDVRHLHTLDIGLVRNGSTGATSVRQPSTPDLGDASPLDLARYRVWHQLELENDGDVPWTTGPALLLRDGLPLGQDLLTYTPVGGSSLLPVTVAVDVRGDFKETEIERVPDALTANRTSYTLLRKTGEITITNYKQERITARVRLSLGGSVEEVNLDGSISPNDFRADDWGSSKYTINNHTDVEWRLDLDPGKTTTLEYVVRFYTR